MLLRRIQIGLSVSKCLDSIIDSLANVVIGERPTVQSICETRGAKHHHENELSSSGQLGKVWSNPIAFSVVVIPTNS